MSGRPTEKTEDIIRKIEDAAALDSTVEEMAFYAGIHRATLYRWMEEDEELKDRIDALRERPVLKARQAVVKGLDEPEFALKYLERKKKKEFSLRTETDITSGGKELPAGVIINTAAQALTNKYEEELKGTL